VVRLHPDLLHLLGDLLSDLLRRLEALPLEHGLIDGKFIRNDNPSASEIKRQSDK